MKSRLDLRFAFALMIAFVAITGCRTPNAQWLNWPFSTAAYHSELPVLPTDRCATERYLSPTDSDIQSAVGSDCEIEEKPFEIPAGPNSFANQEPVYFPMSLHEVIGHGIRSSKIIRDLGGSVLRNPEGVRSAFDSAMAYHDPQVGEEAALSAFDTNFFSQVFFEKNDRVVNNQFLATDGVLKQDLGEIRTGFRRRSIDGGLYTISTIQGYDFNNSIGNRYGNPSSSWSNSVQGELRQSLLRGRHRLFNEIAGANVNDGVYNGVLIARTRTDISDSQFKTSVRDYIADVENAYWDLYYAYRDLEAKKMARDNALESWRRIKALGNEKKIGGEADKEGQAREQYYRFEAEVNDALYGRVTDATRSNNGSSAGSFRPVPGVRVAERRLRLLIGMPANGDELIRCSQEPELAPVVFDWQSCVGSALAKRAELYQQRQRVRRAKMQLLAAKLSVMPELDFVGRYTFRGFGHDLIGSSDLAPAQGAVEDTFDSNNHEWQLGLDLKIPVGYRKAYAAVRNNENRVAREQTLLHEQKRQIVSDLSDAFQEVERAQKSYELQYNRLDSALSQYQAILETNRQRKAPFNLVLEAQRRVLEAQVQFYRAQVEYVLAIRNVHFEKGSLFEHVAVSFAGDEFLTESQ